MVLYVLLFGKCDNGSTSRGGSATCCESDVCRLQFCHRSLFKNALNLVYLSCAKWVASFFEGYCWTRTRERQASRMRARYLRAVLRHDIEYLDLEGATTSEVITSISGESIFDSRCAPKKAGSSPYLPRISLDHSIYVSCKTVELSCRYPTSYGVVPFSWESTLLHSYYRPHGSPPNLTRPRVRQDARGDCEKE